jgi:hypothetical protein
VLTGRVSESTLQGHEWTSHGAFYERHSGLQQIQLCLHQSQPWECIDAEAARLGLEYDHVYITRQATLTAHCRSTGVRPIGDTLVAELEQGGEFLTVYRTEAVQILADLR